MYSDKREIGIGLSRIYVYVNGKRRIESSVLRTLLSTYKSKTFVIVYSIQFYISTDPKNLFAPHRDYLIMNWYGKQCLVIPCKPTSATTKLSLLIDGNEVK